MGGAEYGAESCDLADMIDFCLVGNGILARLRNSVSERLTLVPMSVFIAVLISYKC
jgi:hypothetical protein